jgi:hypothetical protein
MMITATPKDGFTFVAECKAFYGEAVRKNVCMICGDGLRVWDRVADSFTDCHSLSKQEQKRLIDAHTFRFGINTWSGRVHADNFAHACERLRDALRGNSPDKSGVGWVRNHDGNLCTISERDL